VNTLNNLLTKNIYRYSFIYSVNEGNVMKKFFFALIISTIVPSVIFSQTNTSKMKVQEITSNSFLGPNGTESQVWITVKGNNNQMYTLKPPYFKDFNFINVKVQWAPTIENGNIKLNFAPESNAVADFTYGGESYQFIFTVGTEFTIVIGTEGNRPVPVFDGNWTKKQ
jgi:hypothetical protein